MPRKNDTRCEPENHVSSESLFGDISNTYQGLKCDWQVLQNSAMSFIWESARINNAESSTRLGIPVWTWRTFGTILKKIDLKSIVLCQKCPQSHLNVKTGLSFPWQRENVIFRMPRVTPDEVSQAPHQLMNDPASIVLSRKWRCSVSSTDRRCSNYIWVIINFIAY